MPQDPVRGLHSEGCAPRAAWRYAPGVVPVQRRKARWKAVSSENPSRAASWAIGSCPSLSPAMAASLRTESLSRWKDVPSAVSRRRSVAGLTASRAAISGPPAAGCG